MAGELRGAEFRSLTGTGQQQLCGPARGTVAREVPMPATRGERAGLAASPASTPAAATLNAALFHALGHHAAELIAISAILGIAAIEA